MAEIIDVFGTLYGWIPAVTLDLSLNEIYLLVGAANKRSERQAEGEKKPKASPNFGKKGERKTKQKDGDDMMQKFMGINSAVVEDLAG